jgi:hypothetical protein
LGGVLFDKAQVTLLQYPGNLGGSYNIPDSVTSIGEAFEFCSKLTGVAIGSSVTNIGGDAFYGCTSLTVVTIPNSVTSIGYNAFVNCTSLTSVTIPDSVTSIGYDAFGNCTSLTSVTFGSGVTNITSYAFYYDTKLTGVYFQGNSPTPTNDLTVFSGDTNGIVYYLPATTGWGTNYDGLQAVLWNPQAQTRGDSFGVRTNQFGFNITGNSNLVVVVEACSLTNSTWVPLQTITLTGGSSYFSDPQWTNYPVRCYRLRSP